MNQIIKAGALVCALAMLEWNAAAVAEEKRLGDYIYVPAMSAPGSVGTISLRVEGVTDGGTAQDEDDAESLQDGSEQPVVTDEAIPAREAETPSEGITDSSTDESAE